MVNWAIEWEAHPTSSLQGVPFPCVYEAVDDLLKSSVTTDWNMK
jgi:hypothetical protein